MFVYGVCVSGSGKFEGRCKPALDRAHLSPVLVRRHQRSIFEAYASLIAEARNRYPMLEGLVLLHEDVEILSGESLEPTLRHLFGDPGVGIVGVVGGLGQNELSWWKAPTCHGHVRFSGHEDDFSRGVHAVTSVDGMFMALAPRALGHCVPRRGGYPAWHGYDAEMCMLARRAGLSVMVADIEVYHDCKPGPWGRPEYGQAMMEWQLRWGGGSRRERVQWRMKRGLLATAARVPLLASAEARRERARWARSA